MTKFEIVACNKSRTRRFRFVQFHPSQAQADVVAARMMDESGLIFLAARAI
jgi:hypothetical protein